MRPPHNKWNQAMTEAMPSSLPGRFNLARYCLAAAAANTPNKTALIIAANDLDSQRWTYAELDMLVRRLAAVSAGSTCHRMRG